MAKRKSKVVKEFNDGTQTRAAFFGMLKSGLRRMSIYWRPIKRVKEEARRPYKGTNKRLKWEYQCSKCKAYFPDSQIVVDHIEPVGSLSSFEDVSGVVQRLFVEHDKLQVLCKPCHLIKSNGENSERRSKKHKN